MVPNLTRSVFPAARPPARWITNAQVLPYPLRGDFGTDPRPSAARLPDVRAWTAKGMAEFNQSLAAYHELEERRLGYVAFTRARRRLVASGHWWGPTQKRPRGPSPFLEEVARHCAAGHGVVEHWAPEPAEAANPHLDASRGSVPWPAPLDAAGLAAGRAAARRVSEPTGCDDDLDEHERALVAGWDHEAALLLDELTRVHTRRASVPLPAALSTTQLQRLAADPGGLARELARPMPRRPAPAARLGTRFHAWVESLFGEQPLLPPDELPGAGDAHLRTDTDLTVLQEGFLRTAYAARAPHAVEAPFALVLAGRVVRGRIDAVYLTDGGYEVVDWKTGAEDNADPLQLAIYRLAWADIAGVPAKRVVATFLYVRSGRVVRPRDLPGRAELERLLAPPAVPS